MRPGAVQDIEDMRVRCAKQRRQFVAVTDDRIGIDAIRALMHLELRRYAVGVWVLLAVLVGVGLVAGATQL